MRDVSRWLLTSREHTNYTYDLTANNMEQMAWFIAAITDSEIAKVKSLMDELVHDEALKRSILDSVLQSTRRGLADAEVRFGRRIAWYALVRLTRPSLVVETGTDKGLGSVVLAAALERNGNGRLVTIDVNPDSGYLIRAPYDVRVDRVIGDSLSVLSARGDVDSVDMFLHDSDHSSEHEEAELLAVEARLAPGALVMSDNAHASSVLARWAEHTGRCFLYFAEEPRDHWFPGAGLGVAWERPAHPGY